MFFHTFLLNFSIIQFKPLFALIDVHLYILGQLEGIGLQQKRVDRIMRRVLPRN